MNDDSDENPRPGVEGLDRIGDFMGRVNETGQAISRRHLEIWNELSASLREPKYGADDWARNSARVAASMIDDVQAVLNLLTTAPDRRPVAGAIPTVFLFIELDEGADSVPDPQRITAPDSITRLPEFGRIALSGGPSSDAAKKVRNFISVARDDQRKGEYSVVYTRPEPQPPDLEIGSYFGLIYLHEDGAGTPVADLRVVVRSRSDG